PPRTPDRPAPCPRSRPRRRPAPRKIPIVLTPAPAPPRSGSAQRRPATALAPPRARPAPHDPCGARLPQTAYYLRPPVVPIADTMIVVRTSVHGDDDDGEGERERCRPACPDRPSQLSRAAWRHSSDRVDARALRAARVGVGRSGPSSRRGWLSDLSNQRFSPE